MNNSAIKRSCPYRGVCEKYTPFWREQMNSIQDARRMENLCEGNFSKGFNSWDYCPHRFNAKGALEKRGENEPLIVAFSNS